MKEILEKSLLQKIERLEAFEERMGVRLEKFSINYDGNYWLKIYLEAHPITGNEIKEDITLECVIYSTEGNILEMDNNTLYQEDFFGFEVVKFSFGDNELADRIGKIRIYPKRS
jgi:hypothetical protein